MPLFHFALPMNRRTEVITQFAVFATKPEFRNELLELVHDCRDNELVARKELYECALQCYLFAGFPAALEAVRVLHRSWPIEQSPEVDEQRLRQELLQYDLYLERGEALYKKVYAANAGRVRQELLKLSPELAGWAVTEGYGKTLSRPGLIMKTRELAIVGMLTQLGWERQLYSHILGAKNVGASLLEIEVAIRIGALRDDKKEQIGLELLKRLA